jgi:murein DD-endopeptidase MepM/ murein hydrolase activator NlpD
MVPMIQFAAALSPARWSMRGRLVVLTVTAMTATGLVLAPVGHADTRGDKQRLDREIAALRSQLEDTSADLANAYIALRRTQGELPGAQQELVDAQAKVVAAQAHDADVAQQLAVAQANEAKATDSLAQNQKDTESTSNLLGDLARQSYQEGGMGELSVALNATSPDDFATRVVLMDTVMRLQNGALRRLATQQAEGKAEQSHLVAVHQQVAQLKVQADQALAAANAAQAVAVAAKQRLDLLLASQTKYAAAVAGKKKAESERLSAMQAQSAKLQRILAERARLARLAAARAAAAHRRAVQSAPSSGGYLSYPVGGPTGSEFGMRFDPVMLRYQLHAGLDFPVDCGTPVHAAADGDIIMAVPESSSGGYGNMLVIDHGIERGVDLTTTYNHLSSWVRTGGHVQRGEVIAYSGTTGFSTGCHLHFETRQDGAPVNPRNWL